MQESPLTSPTTSQMLPPNEPHQLMVIESIEPFQIDKEYLSKEMHLPKHDQKRKWFSLPNSPPKLDTCLGMNGISVWKEIG